MNLARIELTQTQRSWFIERLQAYLEESGYAPDENGKYDLLDLKQAALCVAREMHNRGEA